MPAPKYSTNLSGVKVVIIGGSSGIGFAVAQHLIEDGACVVLGSRTQAKIDSAIARLSDGAVQYNADAERVRGWTVDVTGPEAETSLQAFFGKVGRFDHLVFTAGELLVASLESATYDSILHLCNLRLVSSILAVKTAVYGGYIKDGGSITLTSGSVYKDPMPNFAINAAVCGATVSFTRALAYDLSPRNVRVNAVSPGPVQTELIASVPAAMIEQLQSKFLTARIGQPEDLALSYVYFIKNPNVTGETLNNDSGSWASRPELPAQSKRSASPRW
ncbi:hypothetical protein OC834_005003 [Tilletia horrida]|uniref:NAD(P)-binding protein n=1 Tax=Tilletia horrida TaxID=155126 RepID=A0AAN6GG86_9BASI|nr:hypothetical protein OC834_005003 [Tilletia horrida]KAK0539914.1 hypothetical protein OC842_000730 [Tilletia horrida]